MCVGPHVIVSEVSGSKCVCTNIKKNGTMDKCPDYQGVLIRPTFINILFPVHRLRQLFTTAYVFIMCFIQNICKYSQIIKL